MAARRLAALFFAIAIAIVLPTIALAAVNTTGAGLVPCGVSSDPTTATECEACNLVQLIQGIITFLIGLAVPIAMGMFVWAGVLYFTSATNSENIGKAKNIFSSAAVGFALALSSWIIVNTILNTVLDKNMYPNSSWFKVDCSSAPRQRTNELGSVITKYLPVVMQQPSEEALKFSSFTPTYSCDESKGFVLVQMKDTYVCDNGTQKVSPKITQTVNSGASVVCPPGNMACSVSEIMRLAGVSQARAQAMSCIAVTESSGNPNARSTVPGSSACGTFQILEKTHWGDTSVNSGACASNSCTNAECNIKVAIALGDRNKKSGNSYYSDWTCPGCNNKAAACVAKYDPGN